MHAWNGTWRLRDGPRGLRPPQRGNRPRTPRSPSQCRAVDPSPWSRARLPRGQQERGRPGGGPRRQPAAGRPQAAAGARLAAHWAARELQAPSGVGGAGRGGRGAAGGAEPGARREHPGWAARRALGDTVAHLLSWGSRAAWSIRGLSRPRGAFPGEEGMGAHRVSWTLAVGLPGPAARSCPDTVLTPLLPQRQPGGKVACGTLGADTCPGAGSTSDTPKTPVTNPSPTWSVFFYHIESCLWGWGGGGE